MMSDVWLRVIRGMGGSLLCWAAVAPLPAQAEEASNARVASAIEAQFMTWGKNGTFASGSPVTFSTRDTVGFESEDPGNPFTDVLASIFTLKIVTRLPFMGVGERPAQDLRELVSGLQSVCEQTGGTLERKVPQEVSGSTPQVNQNLAVLKKASLIGRFTCQSPQEASRFMVEVDYAPAASSTLIPPGWEWGFAARLINATQLQAKDRRASEYATQIQSIRSNVKPGMEIQVLAADLPEELGAPLKRVHGGKPSVCAMVIDVKPPLAQIQVKQASLFVPIDKLLPKGEAKPISKLNAFSPGFPHKWCGQY
jgi:hypothetical protein